MSRYIDADALDNLYTATHDELIFAIEEAPTADVVEVVRCKDCKWYVDEGMYCANDIIVQFDHFYCYNGERREDDKG